MIQLFLPHANKSLHIHSTEYTANVQAFVHKYANCVAHVHGTWGVLYRLFDLKSCGH